MVISIPYDKPTSIAVYEKANSTKDSPHWDLQFGMSNILIPQILIPEPILTKKNYKKKNFFVSKYSKKNFVEKKKINKNFFFFFF